MKFALNKVSNNFELTIISVKNLAYRYGKKNSSGLKKALEGDFVPTHTISQFTLRPRISSDSSTLRRSIVRIRKLILTM